MSGELLTVRHVTHAYRTRKRFRWISTPVLQALDLSLGEGEVLGLIGESGSGKSTFARLACGLEHPSGGQIRLHGRSLRAMALVTRARHVQLVFQQPGASFNPRRRIGAAIGEPLRHLHDCAAPQRRERVAALLAEVGLSEEFAGRFPHELSGGQLQRAAIARTLAAEPSLLILDEPTSALDVSVQARILRLLARLRRERGMSLLFISHDLGVVRALADRIAVLHAGRLVECRETDALIAAPTHPYTRGLIEAVPHLGAESRGRTTATT